MWWFEKEEDCGTARGMARGTVRGMGRGMVRGTVQGTARKHKILTTRFVLRSVVVLSIKACTGGGADTTVTMAFVQKGGRVGKVRASFARAGK